MEGNSEMQQRAVNIFLYLILPLSVLAGSLFIGPSSGTFISDLWNWMAGTTALAEQTKIILWDIRLPRILLVFLTGAVLSASGGTLQAVFRNPLVDPFILGLSSGAAFGAALSVAFPVVPLIVSAFIFGIAAAALSYFSAMQRGLVSTVSLVLSGVVVSGIFTALLTVVQFISDPFKLQSIVLWTMGHFHTARWEQLQLVSLPMLGGLTVILIYRWRLNVMALGDDEARTAGIHPVRDRLILLFAVTAACSAAVAVSGIIGFYGLITPHIVRMVTGADHRKVIPMSVALGGTLLVLMDDLSRSMMSFELPIGIFTMLAGAPVFLYLMKRERIGWES
jgi:iron complex transport system permease protein